MNILTERLPSKDFNQEWAGTVVKKWTGVRDLRSLSSKLYPLPSEVPTTRDVILYYTESTAFVVEAITKFIGINTFKDFVIGVAEAECAFRSEGYKKFGYIGLDTATRDLTDSSQSRNVPPEVLKHGYIVAFAQGRSRYAIGFPETRVSNYSGERFEISALASYLITTMARLSNGNIASEGELLALTVWAINTWRGVNQNVKRYLEKMAKFSGYNAQKVLKNYLTEQKGKNLDQKRKLLILKMNKNFF